MRTGGGSSHANYSEISAWGVNLGLPHRISPFLTAISPAETRATTGIDPISERWRDSFLKVYFV